MRHGGIVIRGFVANKIDGLLTSLGALTWPVIHDHVEGVVVVTDEQIIAAMRLAWERAKLLIERSAPSPWPRR